MSRSARSSALRVAPGDAALAAARERVVAPVAEVRVRTQQLHEVRAAGHRLRGRCLPGQRIGRQVVAGQSVAEPSPGAPTQRRGIRPPFPEDRLHVVDGRPVDGGLHVVPGRVRTVGARPSTAPGDPPGDVRRRDANGTGRSRRRRRCRAPVDPRSGSPPASGDGSPPVRTRMSSRASAPVACSCSPVCRFALPEKESLSQCDRQIRPRTSTPRRSAAPRSWTTVESGSSVSC